MCMYKLFEIFSLKNDRTDVAKNSSSACPKIGQNRQQKYGTSLYTLYFLLEYELYYKPIIVFADIYMTNMCNDDIYIFQVYFQSIDVYGQIL